MANGPAADYPVVVGDPYEIDGVTYTPNDRMNYDAVGRADVASGAGITAAHRTLPLPSYAEVTSLETGRTILVRIERRGPMHGGGLIELSSDAAAQLGAGGNAAVRVRRVNPPEQERAMLRAGQTAPARMDTPKSLLAVLSRKLDQLEGVSTPVATPVADVEPPKPVPPAPAVKPKPEARPIPAADKPIPAGALVVQLGAFSDKARAQAAAAKVGASISPAGKLWRVRMGPYASQAQAEAALAKAKAAGYSEARIQHAR